MPLEGFLQLPERKQKEILSAALQEFSQNGYDLASTNRIVARAGISKGLLFKYFASKENLFLFIIEKFGNGTAAFDKTLADFQDIFYYLEYSLQMDITNCSNDSDAMAFLLLLNKMYLDPNHPVYSKALTNYFNAVNSVIDDYCRGLDASLLREGITKEDLRTLLYFLTDSMRAVFHKDPYILFNKTDQVLHDTRMIDAVIRAGVFK